MTETRTPDQEARFQAAVARQQAGDPAAARALLEPLLADCPDDPEILHASGIVARLTGAHDLAITRLNRALQLRPIWPNAYQLGRALHAAGQIEPASRAMALAVSVPEVPAWLVLQWVQTLSELGRAAEARPRLEADLARTPDSPDLLRAWVIAHMRGGWTAAAAAWIEDALARQPDDPVLMRLAVEVRLGRGQEEAAEPLLRRLCALTPADSDLRALLGGILGKRGDEEGITLLRAVLADNPKHPHAGANLGVLLRQKGRLAEAEAAYRGALAHAPDNGGLWHNLGNLLHELHRHAEAEAAYRRALAAPAGASAETYRALADLLRTQMRYPEAEHLTRRALDNYPDHPALTLLMAVICRQAGRFLEARDTARRAATLLGEGAFGTARALELMLDGYLNDVDARAALSADYVAALKTVTADRARCARMELQHLSVVTFYAPYLSLDDGDQVRLIEAQAATQGPRIEAVPPPPPRPPAGRRLRIGYMSGSIGDHPIGHFLWPVWKAHHRDAVEVFVYALMVPKGEPSETFHGRARTYADTYRDLEALDPDRRAAVIRGDDLDVLVDLNGYQFGGDPKTLARRPAPIQVHWQMHLAGMPGRFMDYTLTDPTILPPDSPEAARIAADGVNLAWLPGCFTPGCGEAFDHVTTSRAAHGLPEDAVVLCAFAAPLKVDAATLDAWAAILHAVPDAVLWLLPETASETAACLRQGFARRGIPATRLFFAGRVRLKEDHLARLGLADLLLDTFPFSAATTAIDAYWAGLPVLGCRGRTAYSRIGASLSQAMSFPDLITENPAAYVALGGKLAGDRVALAALKDRVRAARASAPLFDHSGFTRGLEQVYRQMVGRAAFGAAPSPLPWTGGL